MSKHEDQRAGASAEEVNRALAFGVSLKLHGEETQVLLSQLRSYGVETVQLTDSSVAEAIGFGNFPDHAVRNVCLGVDGQFYMESQEVEGPQNSKRGEPRIYPMPLIKVMDRLVRSAYRSNGQAVTADGIYAHIQAKLAAANTAAQSR